MNKRIRDLNTLYNHKDYLDTLYIAVQNRNEAIVKKLKFDNLLKKVNITNDDQANDYELVTQEIFLSSNATTTQHGTSRQATTDEISVKIGGVYLSPSQLPNLLNAYSDFTIYSRESNISGWGAGFELHSQLSQFYGYSIGNQMLVHGSINFMIGNVSIKKITFSINTPPPLNGGRYPVIFSSGDTESRFICQSIFYNQDNRCFIEVYAPYNKSFNVATTYNIYFSGEYSF